MTADLMYRPVYHGREHDLQDLVEGSGGPEFAMKYFCQGSVCSVDAGCYGGLTEVEKCLHWAEGVRVGSEEVDHVLTSFHDFW